MAKTEKQCGQCKKTFDLKENEDRIALEFKNKKDKKGLRRIYFCSKSCFSEFLKKFLG